MKEQVSNTTAISSLPSFLSIKQISSNNKGIIYNPNNTNNNTKNNNLNKNKIILSCKPIATAVLSKMRDQVCNYCLALSTLDNNIKVTRCSACRLIYYCSKQCQKQDWSIHKKQCPIYKKLSNDKNIKLQQIIADFALNLRVWLLRNQNKQLQQILEGMVCLLQFQPLQKTNKFQQLSTILLQNLELQKQSNNLQKIMKQISVLSINSFTIQDYLCSQQSIGIGIYHPCNYINHSCSPNCQQVFDGHTLKIITLKQIQANEEITISYINRLYKYQQRKSIIEDGYLFVCFCDRCQIERMYDWDVYYMLCKQCGERKYRRQGFGKISQQQLIEDGLIQTKDNQQQEEEDEKHSKQIKSKKIIKCQECTNILTQKQFIQLQSLYQKQIQEINKESNSYKTIKKNFFALKKKLSYSCPIFQQLLTNVYLKCLSQAQLLQNSQQHEKQQESYKLYDEAYILLKDFLQNICKWYRINQQEEQIPYFYGWKYAELGKIAYYLSGSGFNKNFKTKNSKMNKAAEYTEKAYRMIQKIKFTHKFKEVQELYKRYQQIKIALSFRKAEVLKAKK